MPISRSDTMQVSQTGGAPRAPLRRLLAACAIVFSAALAVPACAQEGTPGVLLELFTSQGCSACPPADAMMHELAVRDDVIALALHVDYWDYIGWKDTFGDPAFTARQKGYAKANGARHVYTPQIIIGGRNAIVGAKPMKVGEQIMVHRAAGPALPLTARRDGDRLTIFAPAVPPAAQGAYVLDVVRYLPKAEVEVTRGENAGHTLRHVNIVTKWHRAATWSGAEDLSLAHELTGTGPVVVILQEAGFGPVKAALRIE